MFSHERETPMETCRECGRPLGYLMQEDHRRPGLAKSLRGEGGEAWRIYVTVAVCVLAVLLITGVSQLVGG
jgi:hypothetical protein